VMSVMAREAVRRVRRGVVAAGLPYTQRCRAAPRVVRRILLYTFPAMFHGGRDGEAIVPRRDEARPACDRHSKVISASAKPANGDRKSTRLNSSHEWISDAVFCLE